MKKNKQKDVTKDYREWLLQYDDEESKCKLLFWDLMHHREDDAVKAFKTMNSEIPGFSLAKWFTREDFMDYGFIRSACASPKLIVGNCSYNAQQIIECINDTKKKNVNVKT